MHQPWPYCNLRSSVDPRDEIARRSDLLHISEPQLRRVGALRYRSDHQPLATNFFDDYSSTAFESSMGNLIGFALSADRGYRRRTKVTLRMYGRSVRLVPPLAIMRVPNPNTLSLHTVCNCLGVEAKALTHLLKREAGGVKLVGLVDLSLTHVAATLAHSMASQNRSDRGAIQVKLSGNLVHGLALSLDIDDLELALRIEVTLCLQAWPRCD